MTITKKRANLKTPFGKCTTAEGHRQELIKHLDTAMVLEHATIPPYLCALYSIKNGTNESCAHRIRSVAVEEMLHMVLVANLSSAIGGKPSTTGTSFIPEYPQSLPNSDGSVIVSLNSFSSQAIDVFLSIERPHDQFAVPKHGDYSSIGQFYAAIKDELDYFCATYGEDQLFIGDTNLQVSPSAYYSGGGEVIVVKDYDSAHRAIKVIVDEGEGFVQSIFSGDHEQFGERLDLAHYYKFKEIAVGRSYLPSDSPERNPSGPTLPVDFSESYPAKFYRTVAKYPEFIQRDLNVFNCTYSRLLRSIEAGFADSSDERKNRHFQEAVVQMHEVKRQMTRLMKVPIDKEDNTTGPTFIYVEGE